MAIVYFVAYLPPFGGYNLLIAIITTLLLVSGLGLITVWFSYQFVVYVREHVFCMYCSCSNKSQWLEVMLKSQWLEVIQKSLRVMLGIHLFDRNVWFAIVGSHFHFATQLA